MEDTEDIVKKETISALGIIKAPMTQERMIYDKENQKVIYKSKHGMIIYDPLDWIAAVTIIYPMNGLESVHFYGCYVKQVKRSKAKSPGKIPRQ